MKAKTANTEATIIEEWDVVAALATHLASFNSNSVSHSAAVGAFHP